MLLALYNVFVFIGLGYGAKRMRLLGNKQSGILVGFLLNFSLPAQIFNGIYHMDFDFTLLGMFSIALIVEFIIGAMMFCFARFVLKTSRSNIIVLTFLATFGNTLFLGVPIIKGALGVEFANRAILFDQLCTALPLAFIAPLVLALGGKGVLSARAISMRLFKNPIFLALLFGIGCKFLPFRISEHILSPLYAMGACATPVALFSIGVQLSFLSLKEVFKETSILLVFKMLLTPALFIISIKTLGLGFDENLRMILLQASMPPLVSSAAIIMQAGLNNKIAVSSVALGVIMSAVVAPLFLQISFMV